MIYTIQKSKIWNEILLCLLWFLNVNRYPCKAYGDNISPFSHPENGHIFSLHKQWMVITLIMQELLKIKMMRHIKHGLVLHITLQRCTCVFIYLVVTIVIVTYCGKYPIVQLSHSRPWRSVHCHIVPYCIWPFWFHYKWQIYCKNLHAYLPINVGNVECWTNLVAGAGNRAKSKKTFIEHVIFFACQHFNWNSSNTTQPWKVMLYRNEDYVSSKSTNRLKQKSVLEKGKLVLHDPDLT